MSFHSRERAETAGGVEQRESARTHAHLILLQILHVDALHPLCAVHILKHPQAVGVPEPFRGAVGVSRGVGERVVGRGGGGGGGAGAPVRARPPPPGGGAPGRAGPPPATWCTMRGLHTCTNAYTHTHIHIHSHRERDVWSSIGVRAERRGREVDQNTHTHVHTYTHTHTHTHSLSLPFSLFLMEMTSKTY